MNDDNLITVTVLMEVVPGRRAEVERHISEFCATAAQDDPGTVTYVLVAVDDSPDTLTMFEQFRGAEAIAAHAEAAAGLTETLAPLLASVKVLSGRVVCAKQSS